MRMSNFLRGGRGEDDFTENVITECALFIAIVIIPRQARTSYRCGIIYAFLQSGVSTRLSLRLVRDLPQAATPWPSVKLCRSTPMHQRAVLCYLTCARPLSISALHTLWKCIYIYLLMPRRISSIRSLVYTRRQRKIIRECNPQCVHLPRDECAFVLSLISHEGGGGRVLRCS